MTNTNRSNVPNGTRVSFSAVPHIHGAGTGVVIDGHPGEPRTWVTVKVDGEGTRYMEAAALTIVTDTDTDTITAPAHCGFLAYVIVTDNMRQGQHVGYRAEVFNAEGEFLSNRTYLNAISMLEAAGLAYSNVTGNGWFLPTYDLLSGDNGYHRINITERA